jgi:hypothetical protein
VSFRCHGDADHAYRGRIRKRDLRGDQVGSLKRVTVVVCVALGVLAGTAAPALAYSPGYSTAVIDYWHTPPQTLAAASGAVTFTKVSSRPHGFTMNLNLYKGYAAVYDARAKICWYNYDHPNNGGSGTLVGCGIWRTNSIAGTTQTFNGLTGSGRWGVTMVCVMVEAVAFGRKFTCVDWWGYERFLDVYNPYPRASDFDNN